MIVKLCKVDDLPPEGSMKAMTGRGLDVCVATVGGAPYAVENRCPHQGAPLSCGDLVDGMVVCPYHGWRFRVSDGVPAVAEDPHLTTYELRTIGAEVFIRVPSAAASKARL